MIAGDLAIEVKTAALLSSAYTFPYALVQPALGVTGDFFGKTRLMNLCLLVIALSALVCAVATSFSLLVAMRIAAGLVAGGILPVAMALTGDLVPVGQRQVAIGRLLAVGLTGNLVGSSLARLAGRIRNSRLVRIDSHDCGVLRLPRRGNAAAGAFQSRGGDGQFPWHLRRPTRQGLLHLRVLRSRLHSRALSLRRPPASRDWRDSCVDRGAANRRVRHGWRFLFALGSGSHRPCARAPFDGRWRHARRDRSRPHRVACPMDVADRDLRHVWIRLLPPARLYPRPCHRTFADGARPGRLVAFILLLSWPGRRSGGLRLWFCPWRAGAEHFPRRSGGDDRRCRLLAAVAPPDRILRSDGRGGAGPYPERPCAMARE